MTHGRKLNICPQIDAWPKFILDTLAISCINMKFKYTTNYIVHMNVKSHDSGDESSRIFSTENI